MKPRLNGWGFCFLWRLLQKAQALCDSPLERGGGVCFCFDKFVAEPHPLPSHISTAPHFKRDFKCIVVADLHRRPLGRAEASYFTLDAK
jgi:hypothetical protein